MSDTNETIADIVREIRAAAYIQNADTPESVIAFANRIESAAERERVEWHAETEAAKDARNRVANRMRSEFAAKCRDCTERATGNVAAMRAALEEIYNEAQNICDYCDEQRIVSHRADKIERIMNTALAAPQRNCDRFATAEEARRAFEDAHSREIVHNLYTASFDWLFASAKGGVK